MPTPSIILQKPLIMVSQGDSLAGGTVDGTGIGFGTVVLVYDTCDTVAVGETIMYMTAGQTIVSFSGEQYVIIEETKVLSNEGSSPP